MHATVPVLLSHYQDQYCIYLSCLKYRIKGSNAKVDKSIYPNRPNVLSNQMLDSHVLC